MKCLADVEPRGVQKTGSGRPWSLQVLAPAPVRPRAACAASSPSNIRSCRSGGGAASRRRRLEGGVEDANRREWEAAPE
jgi:hypothetical protein